MKIILILSLAFVFSACHDDTKTSSNATLQKFDKVKWATKEGEDYPYRNLMLQDLMSSDTFRKFGRAGVLNLLGEPDRSDSAYLFYRVAQKRIGSFPLHTKTMVVRLAGDTGVLWVKLHD